MHGLGPVAAAVQGLYQVVYIVPGSTEDQCGVWALQIQDPAKGRQLVGPADQEGTLLDEGDLIVRFRYARRSGPPRDRSGVSRRWFR